MSFLFSPRCGAYPSKYSKSFRVFLTVVPSSTAKSLGETLSELVAVAVNTAMTTNPIKIQAMPNKRPKMNLGVLSPYLT